MLPYCMYVCSQSRSCPRWYWPGSSWTSPPQEPSLLERVAGGLSGLARDLGLMDIIDFVQEVAPLLPEIASDIGTVAGYVSGSSACVHKEGVWCVCVCVCVCVRVCVCVCVCVC